MKLRIPKYGASGSKRKLSMCSTAKRKMKFISVSCVVRMDLIINCKEIMKRFGQQVGKMSIFINKYA